MRVEYEKSIWEKILDAKREAGCKDKRIECIYLTHSESEALTEHLLSLCTPLFATSGEIMKDISGGVLRFYGVRLCKEVE